MDYVVIARSAVGESVDEHVPKRALGGLPDHFFVEAEVKDGLSFRGRNKLVLSREAIKVSELSRRLKEQEYVSKVRMAH